MIFRDIRLAVKIRVVKYLFIDKDFVNFIILNNKKQMKNKKNCNMFLNSILKCKKCFDIILFIYRGMWEKIYFFYNGCLFLGV